MDAKVKTAQLDSNQPRLREIPYNYTSFTDRDIVVKLLGEKAWIILEQLRSQRVTGRSARMLFEVLGEIWAVRRNPYLENDLITNTQRRKIFEDTLNQRLQDIHHRAQNNQQVIKILNIATEQVEKTKKWLDLATQLREKLLKRLSSVTNKQNIAFDSLSRVDHVTDATDWRIEYPLVVLYLSLIHI